MVQRALQSVFEQDYKGPIQLIITDDNSNNETLSAIQKKLIAESCQLEGILSEENGYAIQKLRSRLQPNLEIILCISNIEDKDRKETCRYSVLINFALTKVNGDIVCYLTDDSIWYENKFSVLNEIFQDFKIYVTYDKTNFYNVVIRNDQVCYIDENYLQNDPAIGKSIPFNKDRLLHSNFIDHIALSHRMACLLPIGQKYGGLWSENKETWIYSDWIFWKRLAEFYDFVPVNILLSEKWKHSKCIQNSCTNIGLSFAPNRNELQE